VSPPPNYGNSAVTETSIRHHKSAWFVFDRSVFSLRLALCFDFNLRADLNPELGRCASLSDSLFAYSAAWIAFSNMAIVKISYILFISSCSSFLPFFPSFAGVQCVPHNLLYAFEMALIIDNCTTIAHVDQFCCCFYSDVETAPKKGNWRLDTPKYKIKKEKPLAT